MSNQQTAGQTLLPPWWTVAILSHLFTLNLQKEEPQLSTGKSEHSPSFPTCHSIVFTHTHTLHSPNLRFTTTVIANTTCA